MSRSAAKSNPDIRVVQPLARELDRYRCSESDVRLSHRGKGDFLEGVLVWGTGLHYPEKAVKKRSKRLLEHVVLYGNFYTARKVSGFGVPLPYSSATLSASRILLAEFSFNVSRPTHILTVTLTFVVPSIMIYSSEISPTRCNNCVFILSNGFTLHVSGDNLTHHQQYIHVCCIWPQVSRLT